MPRLSGMVRGNNGVSKTLICLIFPAEIRSCSSSHRVLFLCNRAVSLLSIVLYLLRPVYSVCQSDRTFQFSCWPACGRSGIMVVGGCFDEARICIWSISVERGEIR